MSEKGGQTIIVGNFEIGLQLSQYRTLKISGYIYDGEDNDAVNARIDAAQDALDRQFVRADLVNKEAQIEAKTAGLRDARAHFEKIVEKKNARDRGEKVHLTTQEKELITKFDDDVRRTNADIESLQAAIAKGRQKVNGHLQA